MSGASHAAEKGNIAYSPVDSRGCITSLIGKGMMFEHASCHSSRKNGSDFDKDAKTEHHSEVLEAMV